MPLKNNLDLSAQELEFLMSPRAIRQRALRIFEMTQKGKTAFQYHPEQLQPTVDFVLSVIKENYPDFQIPFHSRWGHFRAGGIDRSAYFDKILAGLDAMEKARAQLDLVITSVLLDAGAGAEWSYTEKSTHKTFSRSEGLGVASYHMFCSGVMSEDRRSFQADKKGLQKLTAQDLKNHFQVTDRNPLVGVDGRVKLLNNLGNALENKKFFEDGRPGNIIDLLKDRHGFKIPATGILRAVIETLGSIWPGRLSSGTVNLGDVWTHPLLGAEGTFESLVPIHKLSQWMTYSLIEPILGAGFTITEIEHLTGLAEYRNGGLMLDMGLLTLVDPTQAEKAWSPDSTLIVEWRALTVHLLDKISFEVQTALGKSSQDFPLGKVLEGGTWWAGRKVAQQKRPGGLPPLNIQSDGTVF